jgi:hypothetical protein
LLNVERMVNPAPFLTLLALVVAIVTTPSQALGQALPAPTPAPAPAPPTAFANLDLPSWMRLGVEFRGRLEGNTGAGFSPDREDMYWLNRFRITSRFTVRPWLSAAIQAQDARVEGRNGGAAGAPFRDQFDLRIASADLGSVERSSFAMRLGRQELAFGDQRLVGHGGWLNTARSFDAVRAVYRYKKLRVDGFASSVVVPQIDRFNKSDGSNLFYGADAPMTILPLGGVVEPYEFVRATEAQRTEGGLTGDLLSSTTGMRVAGKFSSSTDYNGEAAFQLGSVGPDDISAWAGHVVVGHTIPDGRRSYRVFGEYNYASGDATPADGKRGTFDQLYPTAHDKYGLADQVGWKNIHHARTGLEFRPDRRLTLSAGYHSFWLASATDALYNAAGVVLARIPTGASSTHVGQEADVQFVFAPSPRVQITGGYAHLFTGAFLKEATPGQSYSAPYVMVTTMLFGMER